MNNVVLVGRLTDDIKVNELEDGRQVASVTIAVSRNFKNADGIYETDFVRCVLWSAIAENTAEYCHTGDVIGVKGRLQSSDYLDDAGNKRYVLEVVAEKVTFLSSKSNLEEKSESKKTSKKTKKAE